MCKWYSATSRSQGLDVGNDNFFPKIAFSIHHTRWYGEDGCIKCQLDQNKSPKKYIFVASARRRKNFGKILPAFWEDKSAQLAKFSYVADVMWYMRLAHGCYLLGEKCVLRLQVRWLPSRVV